MTNNIALITGGSSGLGFAFAESLAKQGYEIILIARNQERLDQALKILQDKGYTAYGYSADISSQEEMINLTAIIKDRFQKIDFLILNAGVVTPGTLQEVDISILKDDILINLWGTILCSKLFTPLLSDQAKVLLVSSALGLIGLAGYSSYCATKSGIINFGKAFRRELLSRNIPVYVACPGDIDTSQYQTEFEKMPEWMKQTGVRSKPMPASLAAEKILKKCHGTGHILIIINREIFLLYLLVKLLPLRLLIIVLDRMFPIPK